MPITDADKTDFLWKKLIFGVSKTADGGVKGGPNETIASPVPVFGSNVWARTSPADIPPEPPTEGGGVVSRRYGSAAARCTPDPTAPANVAWLATATFGQAEPVEGDWIPPTFGADYVARVWIGNPAGGPAARIFPDAANEEWVFDYTAGVLFFPNAIPASRPATVGSGTVSVATSGIYVEGHRYVGPKGVGGGAGGLAPTGVAPGTYSLATVVVTAEGVITFAASGAGGPGAGEEADTLESVVLRGNESTTPIRIADDGDAALSVAGGAFIGRDLVVGSAAGGGRIELDYPGGAGDTGFWRVEVEEGSGSVEAFLNIGVTPLVGPARNLLRLDSAGTVTVEGAFDAAGAVTGTPFELPLYAHTVRQNAPTLAAVLARPARLGSAPAAQARLVTPPANPLAFSVRRNGTPVGSVAFGAGSATGSASLAPNLTFAAGDILTVAASVLDPNAEGLMLTLSLRYV